MKKELIIVVLLALVGVMGFAQTTDTQVVTLNAPAMAMLNNTGTGTITLALQTPVAPGGAPRDSLSDASTYLQYTSMVASPATRTVSAKWATGNAAPGGTELTVVATVPSGMGTASTAITLSETSQNLITAIPTCYTGTGATDGANLTYVLKVATPSSLVREQTEATITYTISE